MASRHAECEPKPGDLIEIFRLGYQHWAVYVGDGYVIHLAPLSEVSGAGLGSLMSVTADRACVRKDPLSDVVRTDRWRVNNKLDGRRPHRPPHLIVKEAHEQVGSCTPYSIINSNCEHFVTQLRYGVSTSPQVSEALSNLAVGAGVLGAALLCAKLLHSHRKQKE